MEEGNQSKTKYYLYIDECGDQNLEHYDPNFPIFTLCGILVPEKNLNALNNAFNELKMQIFGNKEIIIHSVDLRKWKDDFRVLRDKDLRERFFTRNDRYIAAARYLCNCKLYDFEGAT